MKRTQIKRPVARKARGNPQDQSPDLLPLTARELLKLPGVLNVKRPGRRDKSDELDRRE